MRPVRGLLVVLSGACGAGCFSDRPSAPDAFQCQVIRNVVQSPIRDCDEVKFIKILRHEAEKYWRQVRKYNDRHFSDAYHDGFVEGFVDYVEAGGTGEPPYLPPFRYRLTHDRSPEGVARIEDWNAGWRHGSAVAKESGLRQFNLVTLPGYAVPKDSNVPDTTEVTGSPGAIPRPKVEELPGGQPGVLPPPQLIPPAKDPTPNGIPPRPIPFPPGVSTAPAVPIAPPRIVVPSEASQQASPAVPAPVQPASGSANGGDRPTLLPGTPTTGSWREADAKTPGSGPGSN